MARPGNGPHPAERDPSRRSAREPNDLRALRSAGKLGCAAPGLWQRYYRHWRGVTLDRLLPGTTELVPDLRRLVPPATVFDKTTYGCWSDGKLQPILAKRSVDTLVFTGAETDVCVLASVLGAVDLGYRTILVPDAVCSSSEPSHDAALRLLAERFDLQVELVSLEELLPAWKAG